MLDVEATESLLCQIFQQITGRLCIVAEQNAPRPKVEYMTVKVVNILRSMYDESKLENDLGIDLIQTVKGIKALFCSVNFYRGDTMSIANTLLRRFSSYDNRELLYTNGLGLGERSDIRDINDIIDSEFEKRSQVDITFHVTDSEAFALKSIQSVEIDATLESPSGTYNNEIEVTQ